jgi:DNA-binding transcriptional MerR regulator
MADGLRIGEVANRAQVHAETLRYYERRGLLARPPRSGSSYGCYPPEPVRRIRFVKRAQELGFSLEEIKELLCLQAAPGARCENVRGSPRRARRPGSMRRGSRSPDGRSGSGNAQCSPSAGKVRA